MYLVDTNIFIEVLLKQEKQELCKKFLSANIGKINISDFTLHSIGVILFRYDQADLFKRFVADIIANASTPVLSLPQTMLLNVAQAKKDFNFDFDDAYQYTVAKHHGLKIITMDKDFQAVASSDVMFL